MSNNNELVINRTFNLPVDRIWQAWSDAESCKQWWGPKEFTCPSCTIDFREGGKYLSAMRGPDEKVYWSTGMYKEIITEKKLVCTDSFSDDKGNVIPAADLGMPGDWPMECVVSITFREDGNKTHMELRHKGIPSEMHDDCTTGWQQSFDKLEENMK